MRERLLNAVAAAEHWKFTRGMHARLWGRGMEDHAYLLAEASPALVVAHHRIQFRLKSTVPEIEKPVRWDHLRGMARYARVRERRKK